METVTNANDLILESALLKLPQELLKTSFKAQQKTVERDVTWIQNTMRQLHNAPSSQDSSRVLAAIIERLQNLRERMIVLHESEQSYAEVMRARLTHMEHLTDPDQSKSETDKRMQRMLIEFLLRQGLSEIARKLANDGDISRLLDIELFVSSQRIVNNLKARNTEDCLNWCNKNKTLLRKNQNGLEFEIRRQEYIELIRNGKLSEAITFAQKNLSIHRSSRQTEVDQACALLCYKPDTTVEPYKSLYSLSRWDYLAELFIKSHNELYSIPSISPLEVALSAGLSALKTAHCDHQSQLHKTLSKCPVCSPELNELAKNVTVAYAARSHLVDAINGEAMEGSNEPVVLPNGRLCGSKTLKDWAEKHGMKDEVVMDPVTGEEFPKSTLRKAYIL